MSKREHGEEDDESIKRQKQDDNIDAALLNEGEAQSGSQQYETAATAAAVAHAAYGDLIQHPGDEGKSGGAGDDDDDDEGAENHGSAGVHAHTGAEGGAGDNEGGEDEEEDEEEEEDVDDQIKDPDHVPEDDDDENRGKQSHRRSSGSIKSGLGGNTSARSGSGSADVDLEDAAGADDDVDDDEKKMFARRARRAPAATGSDEWRKQRKDSHKEVERRRRENINTAINKLSELLPVKESSKATVLARAAEYIQKLKETESANIDKWTLQKLLSEQNQSRLSTANERLQDELGRAYKEIESLRQRLKEAGIEVETSNEN